MVAIGGDVRFAASQILESDADDGVREVAARRVPRVLRLRSSGWTRSSWSSASDCRPSRPRRWCRRCWSTGRCCRRPRRASWSSPTRRCGPACCSTWPRPAAGRRAADFEQPGAGQRGGARAQVPLRSRARPPRGGARHAAVRRAARTTTASAAASGCCCRSPRCSTTSASTSACARTTSTRSTCWRRRRSSACRTTRRRSSPTSPATTAAGPPQKSHLPYVALDRQDRLIVNKLAAILRVANALDAEHLQKVAACGCASSDANAWILEVDGDRRPDHGAAGGHRARRHVRGHVRAGADHPARSGVQA